MLNGLLSSVLDTDLLAAYGWRLLAGLRITAIITGVSFALGFVLSYPLCLARQARNPVLAGAALGYVTLFRGTPLLCQLYLFYYGAGEIRPFLQQVGLWVFFREAFFCCLLAFTLNTAAYQSEILRGALSAVPRSQGEAARALGLSRFRVAMHVVWPQAFLFALRPLGNELISIVKVSALSAIVTLLDLMGQTRFIYARTFDFTVYLYAAVVYLAVTEAIRRLWAAIERRFSRHLPKLAASHGPQPAPGTLAPVFAPTAPLGDGLSAH